MTATILRSISHLKNWLVVFVLFGLATNVNSQTWKSLGLKGEAITSVAVDPLDPKTIYAGSWGDVSVGRTGGIFKTTDYGAIWDTLVRGASVIRLLVNLSDPSTLYAALAANDVSIPGIAKSTDGGTTWIEADSGILFPPDVGMVELVMDQEDPDTLYASTGGFFLGKIYKSTDGGGYWAAVDTVSPDTTPIAAGAITMSICPWNHELVYVGTAWSPYVERTHDGGLTWEYAGFHDTSGLITSIAFGRDSNEILICDGIGLYYSGDAGRSWKEIFDHAGGFIQVDRSYANLDTSIAIYVTSFASDSIYESSNYGSTWENTGGTGNGNLYLFGDRLFSGGSGVSVYDTTTVEVRLRPIPPLSFALYQNYPNPFNPTTTISYNIPSRSRVTLVVYDVLGRKVATLVNKEESPGNNQTFFDASSLSSGVYFCQLRAKNFVATQKLMVVK